MQGFVSNSDIVNLTGALQTHFFTFSYPILIYKEPITVINNVNSVGLYGYTDSSSNPTNYTFIPVTGQYPAIVRYASDYKGKFATELNTTLEEGECLIKVQLDARNFIVNGKTEKIVINYNTFNMEGFESVRNYMGLSFYYFKLKATQ